MFILTMSEPGWQRRPHRFPLRSVHDRRREALGFLGPPWSRIRCSARPTTSWKDGTKGSQKEARRCCRSLIFILNHCYTLFFIRGIGQQRTLCWTDLTWDCSDAACSLPVCFFRNIQMKIFLRTWNCHKSAAGGGSALQSASSSFRSCCEMWEREGVLLCHGLLDGPGWTRPSGPPQLLTPPPEMTWILYLFLSETDQKFLKLLTFQVLKSLVRYLFERVHLSETIVDLIPFCVDLLPRNSNGATPRHTCTTWNQLPKRKKSPPWQREAWRNMHSWGWSRLYSFKTHLSGFQTVKVFRNEIKLKWNQCICFCPFPDGDRLMLKSSQKPLRMREMHIK